MFITSFKNITIASVADAFEIVNLLNSAYRGESSLKGWTSEVHLISGEIRSDETSIKQTMLLPNSIFLKCTNEENKIIGCVNLQQIDTKIYLGMFAVSPNLQGGGIGKKMLQCADEYATFLKCKSIYMTVVSVRTELIDWYIRHGYVNTEKKVPFNEDELTGKHLQQLEFVVLEKPIA
jgi:N-acetylglutamate synthase-like GNAT family acetyltransferase